MKVPVFEFGWLPPYDRNSRFVATNTLDARRQLIGYLLLGPLAISANLIGMVKEVGVKSSSKSAKAINATMESSASSGDANNGVNATEATRKIRVPHVTSMRRSLRTIVCLAAVQSQARGDTVRWSAGGSVRRKYVTIVSTET